MTDRIKEILGRERSLKDRAAIAVLAIAAVLQLLDAGFGLSSVAQDRMLAADSVIELADIVAGAAAMWLVRF